VIEGGLQFSQIVYPSEDSRKKVKKLATYSRPKEFAANNTLAAV
jgi:hypothetical protein